MKQVLYPRGLFNIQHYIIDALLSEDVFVSRIR